MNKDAVKTAPDWGHLGFLALFVLATVVFLSDTLSESFRLENIIVILPVSILVLVLCLVQAVRQLRHRPLAAGQVLDSALQTPTPNWPIKVTEPWYIRMRIALFMTLLGLYLLGLIYVAFDLATFLFLFLALVLQREKRLLVGGLYAAFLAYALTWGLKHMVSFPFPTLLF